MSASPSLQTRNRRIAWIAAATAVAMIGATYAAVPLYAEFCKRTGFAGTTQVARTAPTIRGAALAGRAIRRQCLAGSRLDLRAGDAVDNAAHRRHRDGILSRPQSLPEGDPPPSPPTTSRPKWRAAGSTRFPASASASSGSDRARAPTCRSCSFSIRLSSRRMRWTMSRRSRSPIRCSRRPDADKPVALAPRSPASAPKL